MCSRTTPRPRPKVFEAKAKVSEDETRVFEDKARMV